MAAYYPERADAMTQASHRGLVHSLASTYPCRHCRDDFAAYVRARPPTLGTRAAFGRWLCDAHNDVNRKLGKDEFDCSLIDKRWRAR